MAAVRHPEFFTVRNIYVRQGSGAQCAPLCQFRGDRLTIAEIWRYIDFFQNGGRPPSWIFSHVFGPLAESIWRSLSVCKFGWNRCSSFDNVQVFIFCELGFKVPVHDPKWVWGFPLNWEYTHHDPTSKKHEFARKHVI